MKTISIVNQKGGSGKTTTASLLCRALVHAGKKVLAVDTDPQGGLTNCLYETPINDKELFDGGLFAALTGNADTASQTISLLDGWLSLLKADHRLDDLFIGIDPFAISRLLNNVKGFDYCILDTPPTMQGLTRAACLASKLVLVPCELSKTAYEPTRFTVKKLKELEAKHKVLFIGYKEPTNNGYAHNIIREYLRTFGACPSIPRKATIAKQASIDTKSSKTIEPVLEVLRGLI